MHCTSMRGPRRAPNREEEGIDSVGIIQLPSGGVDRFGDGNATLMRSGSAPLNVGKSTYRTAIEAMVLGGLIMPVFDVIVSASGL
mgnify:CR=1 FL=1